MTTQLSFVSKFHQLIELPDMAGWTLVVSPFFDPMRHAREIIEEQRRIEGEGGSIIVLDPKHCNEGNNCGDNQAL